MAKLGVPAYLPVRPLTITCPSCRAKPGKICIDPLGPEFPLIHVERLKAAALKEVAAEKKARAGNSGQGKRP
jgi:hypothetical protein